MILTILRILFLRLRNNPLELLLVFVMPVLFFSIFAAIFSNGVSTASDKKLRVGWIAGRETALGEELRNFLEANSTLQCFSLVTESSPGHEAGGRVDNPIDDVTMDSKIADAQRSGRYDLVIRLSADFPRSLTDGENAEPCQVQLVTDGQNPMAVAMVTSVVKGFFDQRKAALAAGQLMNLNYSNQLSSGIPSPRNEMLPLDDSLDASSPGPPATQELKYLESATYASQILQRALQHFDLSRGPSRIIKDYLRIQWPMNDANQVVLVSGFFDIPEDRSFSEPKSYQATEEPLNTVLRRNRVNEIDDAVRISVVNPQSTTQENPRIAMYAAGIAVLFLLFSSTGNAATLLEEAESGTLDRIMVGEAALYQVICGKWLGIFLLGCVQISVMFLWAELIYQIHLWKHLPGFAVMTLCTAAATASFAMLMATVCRSRAQLNAASVVLILSMSAVGGSMIPRFVMSDRLKEIGKWTFNAWALDGYQKVFWYQSPITSLVAEVTVLLVSALVFGMLAFMFSFRWKCG